jgi:hypothetical protein
MRTLRVSDSGASHCDFHRLLRSFADSTPTN